MHGTLIQFVIPIVVALVLYRLYSRIRGAIGKQKFRPIQLKIRLAVLSLIGVTALVFAAHNISALAGGAAGALIGLALALYAIRHTTFETTAQGLSYTSHPYIGLLVVAAFTGRVLYRVIELFGAMQDGQPPPQASMADTFGNPITLGVFLFSLSYFIAQGVGLILKAPSAVDPVAEI